jgi:hypothetical protein
MPNMSALKIPKEFEPGFVIMKNLSDTDTEKLSQVLRDAAPGAEAFEVVPTLRPVLPTLSDHDVEELVDTLYSMYFLRAESDVSVEQFINDLGEAINESENKNIRPSDAEELLRFKKKLKALLTVPPLLIASKAQALRTDFANIFWDAKIISDIRPIWEGDVKHPPGAAVITNTLKLEYHHIGGHGELYVYLDSQDIEVLMSVLQRAQDKIATIRASTTSKWMKILED